MRDDIPSQAELDAAVAKEHPTADDMNLIFRAVKAVYPEMGGRLAVLADSVFPGSVDDEAVKALAAEICDKAIEGGENEWLVATSVVKMIQNFLDARLTFDDLGLDI